jgi:hypothetical protein
MATKDRPLEFRPATMPVWLMLLAGAGVSVALFWVVMSETTQSVPAKWLAGTCVAGAALTTMIAAARRSRPVTLSSESVTIPHIWRSHTILLAEVGGVGLVCTRPGPLAPRLPQFWFLAIWRSDETIERASVSCAGDTDLGLLAETAAGEAARVIAERVIAVQGPTGLLGSRRLQESVTNDPRKRAPVVAWWSPDGTFGYASAPPPRGNN